MTTQIKEFDAAQALLALWDSMKQETLETNIVDQQSSDREGEEKTDLLNCFNAVDSESSQGENLIKIEEESTEELSTIDNLFENININTPNMTVDMPNLSINIATSKIKQSLELETAYNNKITEQDQQHNKPTNNRNFDTNMTQNLNKEHKSTLHYTSISPQSIQPVRIHQNCNRKETREIATQPEESLFAPDIAFIETMIEKLSKKIQSLHEHVKKIVPEEYCDFNSSENDEHPTNQIHQRTENDTSVNEINTAASSSKKNPFEETNGSKQQQQGPSNGSGNKTKTNPNAQSKGDKLVPIGAGRAMVPARTLKNINWNSYSIATRELLKSVFPRKVLATHSLTGKSSPAFPRKPAKQRLDPVLVNDIVQTVMERCSVPENVVRTIITITCADECKMNKTR